MKISGIDRRSFIVLGSSAVAGLAFPLRAQSAETNAQLFIGFAAPAKRSRAANRVAVASVYAADTVSRTEPSFIRTGARLSFREVHRNDSGPLRLHVDVMHKADGLDAKVPFLAWTFDSTKQGFKSSSPVGFNVPIDPVQPLELNLTFSRGGADVSRTIPFTVANAEGALKLNPGYYIFAVGDRAPDWGALSMDGGKLTRGIDAAPAGFDYLVLLVSTPAA